jgi:hypothetical protein
VHGSGGDIASVHPSSPSLLFPRIMSHPATNQPHHAIRGRIWGPISLLLNRTLLSTAYLFQQVLCLEAGDLSLVLRLAPASNDEEASADSIEMAHGDEMR